MNENELIPMAASLPEPILKDRRAITLYQIAILALAAIGVLTVLGGIALAFAGKAMPEYLVILGNSAVIGLVGLVANNRE